MKNSGEEHFWKQRKDYIKRMMQGFDKLIAVGVIVPSLDSEGQPIIRNGESVYRFTEDRKLLEKFPGLLGNS
jgi:hypothetical protein